MSQRLQRFVTVDPLFICYCGISLTADGGEPGHCGWLKDKYGVSWRVVPTVFGELMSSADQETAGAVMQAMLTMNKIKVAGLQAAATWKA